MLWDNSLRLDNNQINPMCAQRFSIKGGDLLVICAHTSLLISLHLFLVLVEEKSKSRKP